MAVVIKYKEEITIGDKNIGTVAFSYWPIFDAKCVYVDIGNDFQNLIL